MASPPRRTWCSIKASIDDGRILGKHVANAIRFPLRFPNLGIRILNVSLGVRSDDPDVADVEAAVREVVAAGIAVFAAAGNEPGAFPNAPGSCPEAITAGGADDKNAGDETLSGHTHFPSSHGSPHPGVHKPDLLAPAIWLPAPMLPGTLVAREAAPLFQLLSVLEEASTEYGFSETRQVATPEERASVQSVIDAVGEPHQPQQVHLAGLPARRRHLVRVADHRLGGGPDARGEPAADTGRPAPWPDRHRRAARQPGQGTPGGRRGARAAGRRVGYRTTVIRGFAEALSPHRNHRPPSATWMMGALAAGSDANV